MEDTTTLRKNIFDPTHPNVQKFLKGANNPFKMRLYFLSKLPAAWFMGLKVKSVTIQRSEVTLPYGWRSKNPFRSIYFAAQCAAGELATGILATTILQGVPPTAMLVVNIEAAFTKKANTLTTFSCEEGDAVRAAIEKAVATSEPQTITMTAIGKNTAGEIVSEIKCTWSFKARTK